MIFCIVSIDRYMLISCADHPNLDIRDISFKYTYHKRHKRKFNDRIYDLTTKLDSLMEPHRYIVSVDHFQRFADRFGHIKVEQWSLGKTYNILLCLIVD